MSVTCHLYILCTYYFLIYALLLFIRIITTTHPLTAVRNVARFFLCWMTATFGNIPAHITARTSSVRCALFECLAISDSR